MRCAPPPPPTTTIVLTLGANFLECGCYRDLGTLTLSDQQNRGLAKEGSKTARNQLFGLLEAEEEDEFYQMTYGGFTEESGNDEHRGDQTDPEDEVDSDFDFDEGDEPSSGGEAEEPRRKRHIVTKAYKEPLKSLRPRKLSTPAGSSQKTREEKALILLELQDDGS
ncbi:Vacuolar protein sorting-associated protein 72 like protein [Tupaia chinensis]|uniref:Vacuolar protein sorting-associated protein 72 like protein n=1 Tax=Tupaia chinensis TaxID=246437 RepID=L9LBX4_TUPCH|nr:Vacuolar protein sorting-associated protein 72 like protein [Tupaia chinensis]